MLLWLLRKSWIKRFFLTVVDVNNHLRISSLRHDLLARLLTGLALLVQYLILAFCDSWLLSSSADTFDSLGTSFAFP
jgi:hypothetical protein